MSKTERIMDMINVLCLEDGKLNYSYIKERYNISRRQFSRDIEFIRDRLSDIGYIDTNANIEYIREQDRYVYNGDLPKLNEAFVNSTISDALARATSNPLNLEGVGRDDLDEYPVRYMFSEKENVDYKIFASLMSAIKERKVVNIKYSNVTGGGEKSLDVNPMVIINYSQRWYLRADPRFKNGRIITYNLSRIISVKETGETFVYKKELLEDSEDGYGIFSKGREGLKWYTMRFYSYSANVISNQIWHNKQKGKWIDKEKGIYELTLPAYNDIEIMGKLFFFLPDAEPIAPKEFVEKCKEKIKEFQERIQGK